MLYQFHTNFNRWYDSLQEPHRFYVAMGLILIGFMIYFWTPAGWTYMGLLAASRIYYLHYE
jgi:hypothetical protein